MNSVITNIKLDGLTCSACQKVVEKRIKNINGVKEVAVELENGAVKIVSDRVIEISEIRKVLEGTQYKIVS